ncbi:PRD domain-containing protein [Dellaglioa algida]|uniref:PRD domain-containing protein n=1 Tax=Dellaglioa algida TaxID=105612 RepID=UPI0024C4C75D|nr:PRD domain-containing protein [Dellaglioa algida]MDK1726557.1 PRD domain-containing protein [Dellaglioa algida]
MNLIIKKVLNSSVVLAQDTKGEELIVLGKGIGYDKKAGTEISKESINQLFVPVTNPEVQQMESLLADIPENIVDITQQIVKDATTRLAAPLNKTLTFSLMDHINFSLERLEQGLSFKNKLYWEVKSYYPIEFEIGERAVRLINECFAIELLKEEAASIAFHIINAEQDTHNSTNSMEITKLINEIMTIISMGGKIELSQNSISYQRLLTHIKFFAQRILSGKQLDTDDAVIHNHLVSTYPEATKIAIKILTFLDVHYHLKVTSEELTYLIVHIQRNMSIY